MCSVLKLILLKIFFFLFGIVEGVGEGVSGLKPGDHVLPVLTAECRECCQLAIVNQKKATRAIFLESIPRREL